MLKNQFTSNPTFVFVIVFVHHGWRHLNLEGNHEKEKTAVTCALE